MSKEKKEDKIKLMKTCWSVMHLGLSVSVFHPQYKCADVVRMAERSLASDLRFYCFLCLSINLSMTKEEPEPHLKIR